MVHLVNVKYHAYKVAMQMSKDDKKKKNVKGVKFMLRFFFC